jgi:hypothetical protein
MGVGLLPCWFPFVIFFGFCVCVCLLGGGGRGEQVQEVISNVCRLRRRGLLAMKAH